MYDIMVFTIIEIYNESIIGIYNEKRFFGFNRPLYSTYKNFSQK